METNPYDEYRTAPEYCIFRESLSWLERFAIWRHPECEPILFTAWKAQHMLLAHQARHKLDVLNTHAQAIAYCESSKGWDNARMFLALQELDTVVRKHADEARWQERTPTLMLTVPTVSIRAGLVRGIVRIEACIVVLGTWTVNDGRFRRLERDLDAAYERVFGTQPV